MPTEYPQIALRQLWDILRNEARTKGLEFDRVSHDVGVTSPTGSVLAALGSKGQARILLPLKGRDVPHTMQGDAALQITTSHFTKGAYLDITCMAEKLETVFADLVEAILNRIRAGGDCLTVARSTMRDFRELLKLVRSGDFSEKTVAGLVGELLTLDRLLKHSAEAWQAWTGPTGAQHDFKANQRSLEVKTTLRLAKKVLTVNGLSQLQAPSGGKLFLAHITLDVAAGGDLSVEALGKRILSKVSDPDKMGELLKKAGCPFLESSQWNQWAFRLQNVAWYHVAEGFPRIIPEMLHTGAVSAGVTGVRYKVDLSHAAGFALTREEREEQEAAFAKKR